VEGFGDPMKEFWLGRISVNQESGILGEQYLPTLDKLFMQLKELTIFK
jgi:hypothetical protein